VNETTKENHTVEKKRIKNQSLIMSSVAGATKQVVTTLTTN